MIALGIFLWSYFCGDLAGIAAALCIITLEIEL
jgi:hypothetical protein